MTLNADHVVLGGIPLRRTSVPEAVAGLVAGVTGGTEPTTYRFVNAYTIALADQDPDYRSLLCDYGVNLPDGRPVAALLRRRSAGGEPAEPAPEQVRGPSFFEACLDQGRVHGVRHYFLGGSPDTLAGVVATAHERFPGISVAGSESPPFRALSPEEQQQQDHRIRSSGAHIVWVGLGTPRQDVEAARVTASTGVTTAAVGAAFDFFAGSKPQAPDFLRRLYLEWAFRLASEPGRLWRRYAFGNARFVRVVLREFRER